jgi:hypothetical protein
MQVEAAFGSRNIPLYAGGSPLKSLESGGMEMKDVFLIEAPLPCCHPARRGVIGVETVPAQHFVAKQGGCAMKVVLAGGTGQVGTILARHFHQNGHRVVVLRGSSSWIAATC